MLLSAVVLGLMGSLHCVGMCGPIAFMLPVDHGNAFKKFFQVFLYHFGRLLAYGSIGLLFGLLGKGLRLFGMQQTLSLAIGVSMIVIALVPARIFKRTNFLRPFYGWISGLKSKLGRELKQKRPDTFLTIGFLNGFLPCGLVYMAVFASIAMGTATKGGLYMVLFGLGTVPLMTAAVYLGSFLKGAARQQLVRLIPVFVILIGVLFILRGLGLGIPYISPKPNIELASDAMECRPDVTLSPE